MYLIGGFSITLIIIKFTLSNNVIINTLKMRFISKITFNFIIIPPFNELINSLFYFKVSFRYKLNKTLFIMAKLKTNKYLKIS